jgi:Zn-dependent protease/predicted transcriptional regulator
VNGGLPIARLFGIEIRISLAWAVLVAIVTWIGAQEAAVGAPELGAPAHWVIGLLVALGFLASVVAHELAHALVGRRRGVEARTIVLGFAGGLAPLSIEAGRPGDELAIAISGPLVSLGIAVVSLVFATLAGTGGQVLTVIAGGVLVIGGLNLVLGLLSLLPGLPLDGGRVVRAIAWAQTRDRERAGRITVRTGRLLGWSTVGVGVALAFMGEITAGLLILALGWLLATGARSLDRRLALEALLRGMRVDAATRIDVPRVAPNLTVDTFANRFEGDDRVPSLPVVDDERVVGVIGVKRLQRLGRRRFASARAGDVMTTPPKAPFLAPDGDLWDAVDTMNQLGHEGLAVVDAEGGLVGMVTRDSVGEVVRSRSAARADAVAAARGRR